MAMSILGASEERFIAETIAEAVAAAETWRWPLPLRLRSEIAASRALRPAPALRPPAATVASTGRPGARGRRRKRRA